MANGNGRVANAALSANTWTALWTMPSGYKGSYTLNLTNTGTSTISVQVAVSNSGAGAPAGGDAIDTLILGAATGPACTQQTCAIVLSDQQILFVNPNANGVVGAVWGYSSQPN